MEISLTVKYLSALKLLKAADDMGVLTKHKVGACLYHCAAGLHKSGGGVTAMLLAAVV